MIKIRNFLLDKDKEFKYLLNIYENFVIKFQTCKLNFYRKNIILIIQSKINYQIRQEKLVKESSLLKILISL